MKVDIALKDYRPGEPNSPWDNHFTATFGIYLLDSLVDGIGFFT